MANLKVWKFFSVYMVLVLVVGLGVGLAPASPVAANGIPATLYVSKWTEYATNPLFDPVAKAYYPTVVKVSDTEYRMWYGSNSGIGYATSSDGLTWTEVQNPVTGLTNANHPLVEYIGGKYMMWYWDSTQLYSINAIRYAESTDGINWMNDQPLQNGTVPMISGVSGDWNRGSYGAIDVLHNPTATNTGTNPFDYSFAMYFDGTTGGFEEIGLGYSPDGISWSLYGKALPRGNDGPHGNTDDWDSSYTTFGTILKEADGKWHMWYSGGQKDSNDGIGYAYSSDGLNWVRDASNPIMHQNDGIPWRANRTYTPVVMEDSGVYKMWFSGVNADETNYAIGYATADGPFPSIQSAVNVASPGDTIMVATGTYRENVVVNKELTVMAASVPVVDAGGTPGDSDVIGIKITTNNVTVDGLTVINARGTDSVGIAVAKDVRGTTIHGCTVYDCNNGISLSETGSGAANVIDQNTIYNIYNDSGYAGIGIVIWGNNAANNDNFITNNEIHHIARWGISLGSSNPACISANNTISGNNIHDNSLTSSVGVGLLYANSNTITDNTISGNQIGIGLNNGSSNNIVTGNTISNNKDIGIAFYNASNGNTVTGNTVENNTVGILLENASDSNTVEDNTVSSNTWCGIAVVASSNNNIGGNTLSLNNPAGVRIENGSSGNTVGGNTVQNSSQTGILLENVGSSNTVEDNTISGGAWAGIDVIASSNNTFAGNTVSNNPANIRIRNASSGNMVTDNTVENSSIGIFLENAGGNNIIENNTASSSTWGGISVVASNNNTIRGNILSNASANIRLEGASSGNTLENNDVSLSGGPNIIVDASTNNSISSNNISGGGWGGVQFVNGATGSVHFNNILGNSPAGVINDTGVNIDATNNWWGANDGPSGYGPGSGDAIYNNVLYDPWLVLKTNANPTGIIVGGADTSLITADMTINSDDQDTSGSGHIPDGTEIIFTTDKGSIGSLTSTETTTNGKATVTLTSSKTVETATVCAEAPHGAAVPQDQYKACSGIDFVPGIPQQVGTATGTGTATFSSDIGQIAALTAVAEGTLPAAGKPTRVIFPHGLFSFNITKIAPGSTVTVTITLPYNTPVGTQYWKCQGGVWVDCTSLLGDDDDDNVLTLTLTDGGLGDADGIANGTIVDPGGPGSGIGGFGGGGSFGGGGEASAAVAASAVTMTANMLGNITTARVSSSGILDETLVARDAADRYRLEIDKNARVMLAGNRVPLLLTFREESTTPPAPENAVIVGKVYEFNAYSSSSATAPSPVTISPPARLILTYDSDKLPQNVSEVFIAYYDTGDGWLELSQVPGVVAEIGKAHGMVSHFTPFAVLAKVAEPAPAKFNVGKLTITPSQAKTNQAVNVSVNVANTGGTSGSYTLDLKVNGVSRSTKQVTIAAGKSQTVDFTVTEAQPGTYTVDIAGQRTSFVVVGTGAPLKGGGLIAVVIAAVLVLATVVVLLLSFRRRAY